MGKLPLPRLASYEPYERAGGALNSRMNKNLVDSSALATYRILGERFWNVMERIYDKRQRLHCTDCSWQLEQMSLLSLSAGCASLCPAGCCDMLMLPRTPREHVISIYHSGGWATKSGNTAAAVGSHKDCSIRWWTFSWTSPSGRWYAVDGLATTIYLFVWWLYWSFKRSVCHRMKYAHLVQSYVADAWSGLSLRAARQSHSKRKICCWTLVTEFNDHLKLNLCLWLADDVLNVSCSNIAKACTSKELEFCVVLAIK